MKRRGFLETMIKAMVACAALPSATTYARIWKPVGSIVRIRVTPVNMVVDISTGECWEWGLAADYPPKEDRMPISMKYVCESGMWKRIETFDAY